MSKKTGLGDKEIRKGLVDILKNLELEGDFDINRSRPNYVAEPKSSDLGRIQIWVYPDSSVTLRNGGIDVNSYKLDELTRYGTKPLYKDLQRTVPRYLP